MSSSETSIFEFHKFIMKFCDHWFCLLKLYAVLYCKSWFIYLCPMKGRICALSSESEVLAYFTVHAHSLSHVIIIWLLGWQFVFRYLFNVLNVTVVHSTVTVRSNNPTKNTHQMFTYCNAFGHTQLVCLDYYVINALAC